MTDTLPAADLDSRFPCPVPWCEGRTWTHGADGAVPDDWMNEAADIPLPGGLITQRGATAPDGERWSLRRATYGETFEASSPGIAHAAYRCITQAPARSARTDSTRSTSPSSAAKNPSV